MKLIEQIILPNGLMLNIFDLSRGIAADTTKVEVAFKINIDLKESFFQNFQDYQDVKRNFGEKLVFENKEERTFVKKDKCDAIREELINIFKKNLMQYLGTKNFDEKYARSLLRDIRKNPYKYQFKAVDET
ncbi:MAG: hypothetical protein ABFD50_06675 [Smithella sp.]